MLNYNKSSKNMFLWAHLLANNNRILDAEFNQGIDMSLMMNLYSAHLCTV